MAARPIVSMDKYRAPSLFQPHHARKAIKDAHEGKIAPLVGLYLGMSAIPVSLYVAPMGYDWIWIDWEHSSCNVETMNQMVHNIMFASEGKTMPFVRVPGHDHAAIGYALDAGASIVVPQVETVEEARHVVSAAKFGTRSNGTRSAPPFRLIPGLTDTPAFEGKSLHQSVNEQAAIMIQVESLQAIKNLDAILAEVPDIDAVWLGSLDARVSMNLPGGSGTGEEPEWLEAVALFKATMAKHPNVAYAGFSFGEGEQFRKGAEGMAMLVVAADVIAMMQNFLGTLGAVRGIFSTPAEPAADAKVEDKAQTVTIRESEVLDTEQSE